MTAHAWLMLTCLLLVLCGAVTMLVDGLRSRRKRERITRVEPRCERTGSQDEFMRRLRAGGVR